MRTQLQQTIGAALLLMIPNAASQASIFFSTDNVSDELVRINSATGHVTTVGSLGFNAVDLDLISVGSRLFALNSVLEVRVDLHEIDPATGASISSVQVHSSEGNARIAEGLAQLNGQLKIGFRVEGAPVPTASNALGDLGLDGLVTNIQTNSSSFENSFASSVLDFDGLGVDESGGQLYGSDGRLFGRDNDTRYFSISESPLSIDVFYENTIVPFPNIDDIVILDDKLFAIGDAGSGQLYTLDLSTNAFSGITLNRPGEYSGLALGSAVVPELSSLSVWGVGLIACFATKLYNKRRRAEGHSS